MILNSDLGCQLETCGLACFPTRTEKESEIDYGWRALVPWRGIMSFSPPLSPAAATEQGVGGSLMSLDTKKGDQVRKVRKVGQPLQSLQEPVPLEIHVLSWLLRSVPTLPLAQQTWKVLYILLNWAEKEEYFFCNCKLLYQRLMYSTVLQEPGDPGIRPSP